MTQETERRTGDLAPALRALSWTVHRLVPATAGIDPLPPTELAVLKHVLDAPGVTVSAVARDLGLQQSNTSAAVRALVERDLLVRESDPADRRVTRLQPSAQALTDVATIDHAWSGTISAALARLDRAEVAALEAAAPALRSLDRALRSARLHP